jgi:hypothetical protein
VTCLPGSDTLPVQGRLRRGQSAPPEDRGNRVAPPGRPPSHPPAHPAVPVILLCDVAGTCVMTELVLLGCAALTFSIFAGVINGLSTRRPRPRRPEKPSPALHQLTHHRRPCVSDPRPWRALHFVGLFFGFLFATCVGLLLLRAVYRAVVD